MAGYRIATVGQASDWPRSGAVPRPFLPKDVAPGAVWPVPPSTVVRIRDRGYFIDVEFVYDDEEDSYVATGIAVRRGVEVDPEASDAAIGLVDYKEGAPLSAVLPRDIVRMPLATYVRAATAVAVDPLLAQPDPARPTLPQGRPIRGEGHAFYSAILRHHDWLRANGDPEPARTIARVKRVRIGTVHQWLYRGRHPTQQPWPKIRRDRVPDVVRRDIEGTARQRTPP